MPHRWQEHLAVAILVAWGASIVLRFWGMWGDDLSALYFAARFAADGAWDVVYASPPHIIGYGVTPAWDAEAAALGYPGEDLNRYVYPPLWAALFAPVAMQVDPQAFYNAFLLLHAGALVAAALACRRMIPSDAFSPLLWVAITVALLETSLATMFTFALGQPQALVVALCLVALERAQAGRQGTAGALLALAAAIKVAPGLLVLAFVVCGMWGAVRAFALVGAALLALSVALSGVEAHLVFLDALAELERVVLLLAINPSASAVLALSEAVLNASDVLALPHMVIVEKAPWIAHSTMGLALAAVAASLWAVRHVPVRERIWLAGGMLYLVMTFFGGFAWVHYMVLPILMLPGVAAQSGARAGLGLVFLFGAAQSATVINASMALGAPAPQVLLGTAVSVGLWAMFACAARRAASARRAADLPEVGAAPA